MTKTYKDSGVDTRGADEWVDRIADRFKRSSQSLLSSFDAYAAVYENEPESCVAISCDGVGTKILWTKAGLGSGLQIAQDMLAMNVNDLLCVGATPKLFMDYLAVGSLRHQRDTGFLAEFLDGLQVACERAGVLLAGGETAEMPGVYEADQYDVAGFSVGFMPKKDFLSPRQISKGDLVYGFKSSGPHSNGFSWLRKLFDVTKDQDFIKQQLMKPTELYVKTFLTVQKQLGEALTGAFHITGSGFLNFLRYNGHPSNLNLGFDLSHMFEPPHWAQEVQKRSGASVQEMYSSFNMGLGFAICVKPESKKNYEGFLKDLGAILIGEVTEGSIVKVAGVELSEP